MDIDVSDERQVKKRKTKAQLRREKELAELHTLLDTRGGRAFIWRLLTYSTLYDGPVSHPIDGWRQVGMADLGRWVLREVIEAMPEVYTLMRNESMEKDDR